MREKLMFIGAFVRRSVLDDRGAIRRDQADRRRRTTMSLGLIASSVLCRIIQRGIACTAYVLTV